MKILFSATFKKQYKKVPEKVQKEFNKRLRIFVDNQFHPLLNNHMLKGKLHGIRSINITGDWRALFIENKDLNEIVFQLIGTHSQLYK